MIILLELVIQWRTIAVYLSKFPMECHFWNCRGATSNDFLSVLFDFLYIHRSSLLVFVETKVHSSATQIIVQETYFNKVLAVEVNGCLGGIWVF